jgi:hypothetical protein
MVGAEATDKSAATEDTAVLAAATIAGVARGLVTVHSVAADAAASGRAKGDRKKRDECAHGGFPLQVSVRRDGRLRIRRGWHSRYS